MSSPNHPEIQQIQEDLAFIKNLYKKLVQILPKFNVADRTVLPYGLKPHTRSVSWLVEQVITQQTKFRKQELGIDEMNFDMPDTCLHDCEIYVGKKVYYINVKAHNADSKKQNKNDISAVERLFMQYTANPDYTLIYAAFGILFDDITIKFDLSDTLIFSPQFMPIYVNPRNDKIQAYYKHEPILRTRKEFLEILQQSSKNIILQAKDKK
jgi:hypothetical protein